MRRHKYGAKKTTVNGVQFDSKAEARYYTELILLQRAGKVKDFEIQPRFELQPAFKKNGMTYRKVEYVADFLVTYSDGRREVIDVKGMRTKEYVLKKKWFEHKFPELTIREVAA